MSRKFLEDNMRNTGKEFLHLFLNSGKGECNEESILDDAHLLFSAVTFIYCGAGIRVK